MMEFEFDHLEGKDKPESSKHFKPIPASEVDLYIGLYAAGYKGYFKAQVKEGNKGLKGYRAFFEEHKEVLANQYTGGVVSVEVIQDMDTEDPEAFERILRLDAAKPRIAAMLQRQRLWLNS